ncbi:MAG: Hpt domain-containing protein [Verrucomicrobia bacterium]|nr:Hpt domain-containing protein [Verrucomicrobiota bacterium]
MIEMPRAIELVRELVPDLNEKIGSFEVEAIDVDDELLEAFYEELDRLSGDLQTGLDASDDEQIRMAAHSIKGMAGTMGFPEISVLAREIEMTVRGGDRERTVTLCTSLIAWAREFVAAGK